jgi:iron-sulfur cluster assembly protein
MITKDMTIGEAVEKYPQIVDTLTSFGVHCVGCHASTFESIEQGLMGHGKSSEEVEECVKKLNEAIKPQTNYDKITLTESAVKKLKEILPKENKKALRVKIKAGGCSGFEYIFSLDVTPTDMDTVIIQDEVKVYVDKISMQKVSGSQIDYKDTLTDAGFKIVNPNATATCGCGSSFS